MDHKSPFFVRGFAEVWDGFLEIVDDTRVHLQPATLPRRLMSRARGRLKVLECLVRRLVMLMALGLTLSPVRARAPAPPLPDGAVLLSMAGPYRLHLFPRPLGEGFPVDAPFTRRLRASGPLPAAPLSRRMGALYRILENPDAYARRLARTLERRRTPPATPSKHHANTVADAGTPAQHPLNPSQTPYLHMPPIEDRRLSRELSIMAKALPGLIREAYKTWETSP